MIGVAILLIVILVAGIWISIEVKRAKHKMFAIFIIALILFGYFSFNYSLQGKEVDLTTSGGIFKAVTIYFSWLGSAFGNLKSITTNAINMDWSGKQTNSTLG